MVIGDSVVVKAWKAGHIVAAAEVGRGDQANKRKEREREKKGRGAGWKREGDEPWTKLTCRCVDI